MKRSTSRLLILFVVTSVTISFTAKLCQGLQKSDAADKTFKASHLKRPVSLPRMIIFPFQLENHDFHNETGLALHFYLSNIIALHTGLDELWFSWKMKKIFPGRDDLLRYVRGMAPVNDHDIEVKREGIRYRLQGKIREQGGIVTVFLDLRDLHESSDSMKTAIELKYPVRLDLFAYDFIKWLKACGLSMGPDQAEKAVWKEAISFGGLSSTGKALKAYYAHSYCHADDILEMKSFDSALNDAPDSYMAANLRGWALYKNSRYEKAKEQFSSSLRINRAGVGALSGLIWCAIKTGDEDEAYRLGRMRARLRNEPEGHRLAIIANRFGNIASKAGETARAIIMYEKAFHCNPLKGIYLAKLASEYSKINLYEKALRVLDTPPPLPWPDKEKEGLMANKTQILLRYAMFLKKSGRCRDALIRLEQAHEIERGQRRDKASEILRIMQSVRQEIQDKKARDQKIK